MKRGANEDKTITQVKIIMQSNMQTHEYISDFYFTQSHNEPCGNIYIYIGLVKGGAVFLFEKINEKNARL